MTEELSRQSFNRSITIRKCSDLQIEYTFIINKCYNEIMSCKETNEGFTMTDAYNITEALLAVVKNDYGNIPPQFQSSLDLVMTSISPSKIEKKKFFKAIVGIIGDLVGIWMVINAIGEVQGWGKGCWWHIKTFFAGVDTLVPMMLAFVGVAIMGISTYIAFYKTRDATRGQKFKESLIRQTRNAVAATWEQFTTNSI